MISSAPERSYDASGSFISYRSYDVLCNTVLEKNADICYNFVSILISFTVCSFHLLNEKSDTLWTKNICSS